MPSRYAFILGAALFACIVLGACGQHSTDPVSDTPAIQWQTIARFDQPVSNSVDQIWATGADNVYVVSTLFTGNKIGDVRLSHFDGDAWTDTSFPRTGGATAIWGSSPDDIYVAAGHLVHFDGTEWTALPLNAIRITGTSADRVFVTNPAAILEFNGTVWDTLRTLDGYPGPLVAASDGSLFLGVDGGVEIWNGASWLETNFPGNDATSILAFGVDDAFAMDAYSRHIVYRWDGGQWSSQIVPFDGLAAIDGTSGSDVFGVGHLGKMLHYDGLEWVELPRVTAHDLYRVRATPTGFAVLGDDAKVLWLDGFEARTLREADIEGPPFEICAESQDHFMIAAGDLIYRYDSGVWSEVPLPFFAGYVDALGGRTLDDAYASFGEGRLIAHFDGTAWSRVDSVAAPQYGFWVTPSGLAYSVGDGAVYRRGTEWEEIKNGASLFYLITGDGANGIVTVAEPYADSEQVVISHLDGNEWTDLPAAPGYVHDLWSGPGLDLYLAGPGGLYHLKGKQFERIPGPDHEYDFVFGTTDGRIFSANENEIAVVTGGILLVLQGRGPWDAIQATDGSIVADLGHELAVWQP